MITYRLLKFSVDKIPVIGNVDMYVNLSLYYYYKVRRFLAHVTFLTRFARAKNVT